MRRNSRETAYQMNNLAYVNNSTSRSTTKVNRSKENGTVFVVSIPQNFKRLRLLNHAALQFSSAVLKASNIYFLFNSGLASKCLEQSYLLVAVNRPVWLGLSGWSSC